MYTERRAADPRATPQWYINPDVADPVFGTRASCRRVEGLLGSFPCCRCAASCTCATCIPIYTPVYVCAYIYIYTYICIYYDYYYYVYIYIYVYSV